MATSQVTQAKQHAVVVLPVADATEGGLVDSAGRRQESQNTRLEIDIGENRTMVIEITLTGKLALQCPAGTTPPAADAAAEQAVENQEYMDQMRGWLMTVGTLFIGMSFQAALQPPSWMPKDWYMVLRKNNSIRIPWSHLSPAEMAAPDNISKKEAIHALNYVLTNTTTFAISLALVSALVIMKRSPPTRFIYMVKVMVGLLCFFVAWSFAIGNGYDPAASWVVVAFLVMYGFSTLFAFFTVMWLPYHLIRPALERLKLLPKAAAHVS
ncbi:hypothetical protein CFC21_014522 [Triticum aestivum]|uniref:PGG domain-containing protein n=2 Tax=Triticum aestivum TaxID=4565 RepID=A0A9R1IZ77_WHEAT|nr:uncharacterized protein LOC123191314 [Triticum aestivum]KAF6998400.1 hypothetical protein CFC21_014522 [Triticum aestivum]